MLRSVAVSLLILMFMLKADMQFQDLCSARRGMENVVNLLSTDGGALFVQTSVDTYIFLLLLTIFLITVNFI